MSRSRVKKCIVCGLTSKRLVGDGFAFKNYCPQCWQERQELLAKKKAKAERLLTRWLKASKRFEKIDIARYTPEGRDKLGGRPTRAALAEACLAEYEARTALNEESVVRGHWTVFDCGHGEGIARMSDYPELNFAQVRILKVDIDWARLRNKAR